MLDLGTLGLTEIVRLQNQLQQELRRRFERTLLMAFSDIVGSTPYFARFGDAVGRQLHQLHFDLLGQAAGDAQGRIVDAVGAGVLWACTALSLSSRRWRERTRPGRASTSWPSESACIGGRR